jgi:hypothetical protein
MLPVMLMAMVLPISPDGLLIPELRSTRTPSEPGLQSPFAARMRMRAVPFACACRALT